MFGSSRGRTTIAVAVFLVVLFALGWSEFMRRNPATRPVAERIIEIAIVPKAPQPAAPPAATAPAPAPATDSAATPPTTTSPTTAATTPASPATAPQPATPATVAPDTADAGPRFDVVRVDPTGGMVVAGRAAPGEKIELFAGDKPVDQVTADSSGQFVMVPGLNLPPGDHLLSLRAAGKSSTQTVSVDVPQNATGTSRVAMADAGTPPVGQGTEMMTAPAPAGQGLEMRPVDGATAAAPTSTPQMAPGAAPSMRAPVAASPGPGGIVVSEMKASGASLTLSGHGPAGAPLRILFNDTVVAQPVIAPDGSWSLSIAKGLVPGGYQIRIEQVAPNGQVVAQVERRLDHVASAAPAPAAPATSPAAPVTAPSVAQAPAAPPASAAPATTAMAPATSPSPSAPSTIAPSTSAPSSSSPSAVTAPEQTSRETAPVEPMTPAGQSVASAPETTPAARTPAPTTETAGGTAAPSSATAAASPQAGDPSHVVIADLDTVQVRSGDSLWVISRRAYGGGRYYGVIYRANRDRIRRPSLIYPGQVLVMPTKEPG